MSKKKASTAQRKARSAQPHGSAQSGKVSDRIARHIFQRFDNGGDTCKRLAARGGQWPEKETSLGGVCESAFASMIEDALNAPNDQALRPRTPGLPSEPGVTD